ncbi:prepilin-type N-terminal cleavage/methylation domain-containing protein [Synechococcus moorigangaii CMS01]|nr:prepilin-type N-terminal cleavage/methylation domain-containing protein [Synechococcus moorigangaii CMS01]
MKRLIVTKENRGFTLIELLTALAIAGILAAIASPSMIGFVNKSRIRQAQADVFGILLDSQRNAIKNSGDCVVTLTPGVESTITSTCSPERRLSNAQLRHNGAESNGGGDQILEETNTLTFNFKGETTDAINASGDSTNLVIIISDRDGNRSYQRCIVISDGIGLVRQGQYPANEATTNPTECIAD